MTGKPFTQPELDFFRREGYFRLSGVHSRTVLRSLKARIFDELSRLKIWSYGKSTGSSLSSLPAFQQIARLSSMVQIPELHSALSTPEMHRAIVDLTGKTPKAGQGSQLLLSLPQGRRSLTNLNWHVDINSPSSGEIPGIQAFYLIDDVAQGGGATLALARSHRVPDEAAGRLRGALKTSTDPETLRMYGTEIVEMSGRAGDVFLMDMRVLHTPSVNLAKNIRMMATTRFDLRAAG